MRYSRTRPGTLALGAALVAALAWQASGAFLGDGLPAAAVTGGGGFASHSGYGLGASIGQPVVGRSTGGNYELEAGLWASPLSNPVATAVDEPVPVPGVHRLIGAYPNPFNPRTEIRFELARATRVRVDIHDVRGRLVRTLINEPRLAGPHSLTWNGVDQRGAAVSSGSYYLRLVADDRVETQKVVLLK